MASIEQELDYNEEEEIELEVDRRIVIMGEEMEVLDEVVEEADEGEVEVLVEVVEEADKGAEGPAVDPKAVQCLLCPERARHPARHALDKHLPWYYSPQTACWVCKKQETPSSRLQFHAKEHHRPEERYQWDEAEYGESWVHLVNGLFRELAAVLKVDYPEGLMTFVNEIMRGVKTNRLFTEQELSLVELFNRLNGYPAFQGKKVKFKSVYNLHS